MNTNTKTISETIGSLKVGDKFTTYQAEGVFTISKIFHDDRGVHAYNSNDIYTYNLDTDDLIKLKIQLIKD